MEPLSTSLAIASIPSIFLSVRECYRCVIFSRNFQDEFPNFLFKLESCELSLTRWGTAMGIDIVNGVDTLANKLEPADYQMAVNWLSSIKTTFDKARTLSQKYQRDSARLPGSQILDTEAEINGRSGPVRKIHRRMRQINDSRFTPRKRDTAKWALFDREQFELFVAEIASLTNNLISQFPASIPAQTELARTEIDQLDAASLSLLDRALVDLRDRVLGPVVKEAIEYGGSNYHNLTLDGRFLGQLGDNIAPGEKYGDSHYSDIKIGGQAMAHIGRNIGNFQGKTIFDSVQRRY